MKSQGRPQRRRHPKSAALPEAGTPNEPPTAGVTASGDPMVVFTDTSADAAEGAIVAWAWEFGDGGDSAEHALVYRIAAAAR